MKFTKQLSEAPLGSFHVLDPEKAKRMNAATLYIPSPQEVIDAISEIRKGTVVTVPQMRKIIAAKHDADTACPAAINKYWKWAAAAVVEEGFTPFPWWRLTKDGKPSRHMPGGETAHRAMLEKEGVKV